jgi:agmatine deiminase
MTDSHTNCVYLTAALARHPVVFDTMVNELSGAGVEVKLISGTANIWARDFMPLQVGDHFVKFRYQHDEKRWPQLHVPEECWRHIGDVRESHIRLDGGNVVRYRDRVLMTEIVFQHNPDCSKVGLIDDLEELLEAEIILLPVEPEDDLGHSDGLCKWVNQNTVLVNDYNLTWVYEQQEYGRRLREALLAACLWVEPFPFGYQSHIISEVEFRAKYPDGDAYGPAVGYYCNFLQTEGLILYPKFGVAKDHDTDLALRKWYPDVTIKGIECIDLAQEGGLLHCVTASYGF